MADMIDDASMADEPTPKRGKPTVADDHTVASAFATPAEAEAHDSAWWQNPANFLKGARPVTRSHIIFARGDLFGRIDELADLEIRSTGSRAAAHKAEATALTSELLQSGMTITLEARSDEWIERFRSRLDKLKIKDDIERSLRQLGAQIVSPDFGGEGEAYEFLREFMEAVQGADKQVAGLAEKMMVANHNIPVVNPRFLAE